MLNDIYNIINQIISILYLLYGLFIMINLFRKNISILLIRIRLIVSSILYVVFIILAVLSIFLNKGLSDLVCAAIFAFVIYENYKFLLYAKKTVAINKRLDKKDDVSNNYSNDDAQKKQ